MSGCVVNVVTDVDVGQGPCVVDPLGRKQSEVIVTVEVEVEVGQGP